MFGYERNTKGFLDDSVTINVFVYDETGEAPVPQADIASVSFTIIDPTGDTDDPAVDAAAGTVVDDGHGRYIVDGSVHTAVGNYLGKAVFTYDEGDDTLTKSVPFEYNILDPFERTGAGTPDDDAVALAWKMISDCFDSELGGPWLRDMTKGHFDHSTVRGFVPTVIVDINTQPPVTGFTPESFTYANGGTEVMAQGLLVATIRHLMRAYTEQPDMVNSPVPFMDRKRYQQAWNAIYQIEEERWRRLLELWKRQFLNLSGAKMILGSRAGRSMWGQHRVRGSLRGF